MELCSSFRDFLNWMAVPGQELPFPLQTHPRQAHSLLSRNVNSSSKLLAYSGS